MMPKVTLSKVLGLVCTVALCLGANLAFAQEVLYVIDNKVGIGSSTPAQKLDIIAESFGGIRVADGTADVTNKRFRLYAGHYSTTEEDILLFSSVSNGSVNTADFGGGAALYNAATDVRFWTAGSDTTLGGVIRMVIDKDGEVGIGVTNPVHPIHMASGARVTAAGVWTDASSRAYKQNIEPIGTETAMETLAGLEPVRFEYKNSPGEEYVGFIAEDVPDLVATSDRTGLSPMDIVAVLTKVVQEQQRLVHDQQATILQLTRRVEELESR